MKNNIFFFSVIIFLGFCILNCNSNTQKNGTKELPKTNTDIEKEKVLKLGERIAFQEYGDVIKNELPLRAKLVGDSLWILEGTLPKGSVGGTVYIEMRKNDNKVLKITHYK